VCHVGAQMRLDEIRVVNALFLLGLSWVEHDVHERVHYTKSESHDHGGGERGTATGELPAPTTVVSLGATARRRR